MPYVDHQVREFQQQFAGRRVRQLVATVPVVTATALLILAIRFDQPIFGVSINLLVGFVFVAVAGLIAFSLANWRCPACGSYLGKRLNPRFCSSCGVQLRADATATEPTLRA